MVWCAVVPQVCCRVSHTFLAQRDHCVSRERCHGAALPYVTTVLAQGGWSGRLEDCFEKRLCTTCGHSGDTQYALRCAVLVVCLCQSARGLVHSCASSVLSCVAHFFSARGSLRVTVTLPRSSPSPPKGRDT